MANPETTSPRRFRIKTVRGEPYHVAGHKFTPVVRVVSYGRARGRIGRDQISGSGGGFASVTPVAFVEETLHGDRRIAIRNATSAAQWKLLVASLALTLFFTAVRSLARRVRL